MIGAVYDLETTGFLDHMLRDSDSRIHCAMFQEFTYEDNQLVKGRRREFYDVPIHPQGDDWEYMGPLSGLPTYLDHLDCLCGHNVIGFDFPILKGKLGYEYKGQIVDSLIISRKNWPDRPGVNPHSVEAWGPRLGYAKVQQEDWSEMNADVRHRCREDVNIEFHILQFVLKEMQEGLEKCQTP